MDFKTLLEQITTLFTKLNKKQKSIIALSTLATIGAIIFLVVYTSSKKDEFSGYKTLFENLSASDSALVISQLESDNIPYQIVNDGTIKVPKDVVYKERITIAAQGIPKSSKVGFELFDTQNFGETDFAQNIKYLRALEGELSKTIQSLNPIEDATVKIALPKESVFVEKESMPTASVVVKTRENMTLSKSQATGIKNLISSSVPKLKPQNVRIIDQDGNPIDESLEDGFSTQEVGAQLKYKRGYERELERKIVKILAPIIGSKDKVSAKVSVDFDFNQKKIHDEYYDPESVVRSEQSTEEKRVGAKSQDNASGVPGAISNITPAKKIGKGKNSQEKYEKSTTTTNYEISKKITDIKGEYAKIRRITAAVVVDGKYESSKKSKEPKYIPLDKTELDAIESITKRTIGYDKKRGDEVSVSNLQFKKSSQVEDTQTKIERTANMITPFLPILKYLFAGILFFVFYKKIIAPFGEKMLQEYKIDEDEDEIEESIDTHQSEEDTLDKYNEAKRKIEEELGLNKEMDEDTIRHSLIVEKMKTSVNEHPEELAKLIEVVMKNNQGV